MNDFYRKEKAKNKKIQEYRRGIRAEIIAGLYLSVTGWRVLAWRRKCPMGEIDLVAKRGKIISFIALKARQNERVGIDTITAHQWRRISEAADLFMARLGQYADCSSGLMRLLLFQGNGQGDLKICGSTSILVL